MTTDRSTSLVVYDPAFADPERMALAGYLAGYRGLTRDAYALDLRQFVAFCEQHHLSLFQVRRADIEAYARTLEAAGKARATVARRLCTVSGFYRYAEEEGLLAHSPAVHVRRPHLDYESHATGLDRNEVGALLVWPPVSDPPPSTPLSPCWPSTGCGSPRPPALTSKRWAWSGDSGRSPSCARAARS